MTSFDEEIRTKTTSHGHFDDTSRISQALKTAVRAGRNWESMPVGAKEALEHTMTLIARIVCGDATEPKHWNNAAGYLRLVATGLPMTKRPRLVMPPVKLEDEVTP